MLKYLVVIIVSCKFSSGVPPRPLDDLQEDINEFKKSMKLFSTQFDKWNSLYTNQLEPRIVSSATLLASIDSNINNLQERAHVWDTFQLHVSAWNDQLSSLDRKMDIISEGQKKLFALDAKINSIANMEYKLDGILKKVEESNESLQAVLSKVLIQNQSQDSLFEEFATRGVLSTLKLMERKLDKIQALSQNLFAKTKTTNLEEAKGKFNVHCKIPSSFEEILKDVSSKVDIIFDKTSSKEDKEETSSDEYQEEQQSGDVSREVKIDSDIKLFKKIIKRITQPYKQTNAVLEKIQNQLSNLESNTLRILENEDITCSSMQSNYSDFLVENINKVLYDLNKSEKVRDNIIASHFVEQRAHFERSLKTYFENDCLNSPLPKINDKALETKAELENFDFLNENASTCDALNKDDVSGIYKLGKTNEINSGQRDFYTRYCESVNNQKWTVIQRRLEDYQNFNLTWNQYKNGFGNLRKSFWFGNEFLHKLSKDNQLELRIELEDFEGNAAWAEYDRFEVESEKDNYKLTVGDYKGNASDSLTSHNNSLFSTFDKKNDQAPDCCPCAVSYGGGWWFNSCFESNLNGVYHARRNNNDYYRGIIWENWLGNYSLKRSKMMVKVRNNLEETSSSGFSEQPETTTIPYYEDP